MAIAKLLLLTSWGRCYIVNSSFVSGNVLNLWLCSVVTPVLKVLNLSSLSHFHPISVTPIISRLAEKLVVAGWLWPHIDSCV